MCYSFRPLQASDYKCNCLWLRQSKNRKNKNKQVESILIVRTPDRPPPHSKKPSLTLKGLIFEGFWEQKALLYNASGLL